MLKKIIGLLFTMSLVIGQGGIVDFFKYSTAYISFSLNAPRHQDDRFAIVGGLSTGILEVERTERELEPDFQTSFGLRKIGRFNYEPKRGVKNLAVMVELGMMVQNKMFNESSSFAQSKVGNI